MKKFLLSIVLIFFIAFQYEMYSMKKTASAMPADENTATLNGFVKDSHTKEALIGATIFIKGTKSGAYTNKSGFFSIAGIKPGSYTVVISSIGYEKHEEKITFKAGQSVRKDFSLKSGSVMSEGVTVQADKEVEKRQITVSKVNIPIKQIKEIRIGGESDLFRSLQMLPGILTSSQISSGLFVRGGSPDQNLVLLDGTTVYNPTHLFGFISTFNSDAIKDVELLKGGFPAEFGNRLSAVLNVTQKDGNKEEVEGIAAVGAISSRLSLEGPGLLEGSSWFVSGRRTYFELIKSLLDEDPEDPLPDFNFYDLNGKYTQEIGDNDKISLSGFMSSDNLEYGNMGMDMNLEIGNNLGTLRWQHIFGDNMFLSTNLSASHYFNKFFVDQQGYEILINNQIRDYTLKSQLEWFNSQSLTTKFGFEMTRYTFELLQNFTGNTDSTDSGSEGGEINLKEHDWNYSIYGQMNWQVNDQFSIQAGLRGHYWDASDEYLLSPRFAMRYQFNGNIAAKIATGRFYQSLRLASMQDFSFFDTWMPTDESVKPSRSDHLILSIETKPADGFDFNFDAYYKKMYNISEINQNAIEGDKVADVFFIGDANAYGIEFFVQKKIGNFTGWAGYALGFINAKFDSVNKGKEFRPKYDRRHDFKIVAQYKIDENWEVGANFVFQSGQSYTGASSRFQSRMPGMNYGNGKVVPSQRYGLRKPESHQLNINVSKKMSFFGLPARLILDVYNVYNHKDIWIRYYNTENNETTVEDISLLPIIPTISYEVKF